MRSRIGSVVLAAVMAISAEGALAQGNGKPAPEESTGLQVGSRAPKFSLKDQAGRIRTLDGLLEQGKVALVFYRSADW
jgi:hypothetical protein